MSVLIVGVVFSWLIAGLFVSLGTWLGFQLVHQNGRLLSHLEGIEQRLATLAARPISAPAPAMPAPAPPPGAAAAPPAPPGLAIGAPALLALAAAGTDGALGVGGVEALGADPSTPNASTPNAPSAALGGTRELAESKLQRDGLPAGTPAPDFTLPLLHGGELS